ncbi:MAG: TusE/DsrC/DsvC family sulfur relay protein [Pseudomonadota bacterium]
MTDPETDREGFLTDLGSWSEQVAASIAGTENLTLDAEHWQIITLLRAFYARTDVAPAMRAFVKLVREEFGDELGNSIRLMQLFGPSPAKTAAKIAGLPRPTHCL